MISKCSDCLWYDICKFHESNCEDFSPTCEEAEDLAAEEEYRADEKLRVEDLDEILEEQKEGEFNVEIGAYPFYRG